MLACVLALPLLLLFLAPGLGLWWVDRWYQQQGEGYRLEAGRWTFSPFAGELTLTQLQLHHPGHASGDETRLQQLNLQWNTAQLWQRHVQVESLLLQGLQVELRQHPNDASSADQLSVAGLSIPMAGQGSDSKADTNTKQQDVSSAEPAEPWRISVEQWQIEPVLRWQAEQAPASQGRLQLSFSGEDFTWPMTKPVPHRLQLQLSDVAVKDRVSGELALQVDGLLAAGMQQWQGDITLSDVSLHSLSAPPLTLQQLHLQQLQWQQDKPQALQLATLQLQQLSIGGEDSPLLRLEQYLIDQLQFNQPQLNQLQLQTGWHDYQGLQLTVLIDESGAIEGLAAETEQVASAAENGNKEKAADHSSPEPAKSDTSGLKPDAQPDVQSETSDSQAESELSVSIAGLRQQGDASMIHLTDASVSPQLQQNIAIRQWQLADVNWQAGALQQPIQFDIELALDDYNRIRSQGQLSTIVRGDSTYPQGQFTVNVEQLNLVPYNGYLAQAMGYHVAHGQLNVSADIELDQGQLDGTVDTLLRNARFEPEDDAVIDRVSKQIAMPVDTALSLLRDDSGNIRLEVPLSGDLSNPDVGLSDLTKQLSTLALRTATMHYLKQSLVPYGTLLSLADYASSQLMAIRLDAVEFEAEQAALTDQQREQLDKVAAILQQKTELELKACPLFASDNAPDDWAAMASQRASWIKQYLAAFNDDNDDSLAARVSLCKPELADKHQVVLGV
ncbi:hypothetical protein CHH28_15780 [Bacterioplanes sanyensis]|uniref:DUF748 domain-containing protein n=1 Tax=Bacterioplanes sanyensis TaxID=1249553 RepID=A0A222FMZ2_9GAMM|nr:hypothetical protein CHH28_15780 [Bacterioplanes sanyensis]